MTYTTSTGPFGGKDVIGPDGKLFAITFCGRDHDVTYPTERTICDDEIATQRAEQIANALNWIERLRALNSFNDSENYRQEDLDTAVDILEEIRLAE